MLGDEDETIRELGVNKILSLRGLLPNFIIPNEGSFSTDDEDSEDEPENPQSTSVRLFEKPELNVNATIYYNMVNLNNYHHQPPVIQNLSDSDIREFQLSPLKLRHPCHNQSVERHVKLVTEAAAQVCGYERRDGLIRQKIKSSKMMKKFDMKKQFK